jgi:hypothetical protein
LKVDAELSNELSGDGWVVDRVDLAHHFFCVPRGADLAAGIYPALTPRSDPKNHIVPVPEIRSTRSAMLQLVILPTRPSTNLVILVFPPTTTLMRMPVTKGD